MASNVTVSVNINAAGNLQNNLKSLMGSVTQLGNLTGKGINQIAYGVFSPQIKAMRQQMQVGKVASSIIGTPMHMAAMQTGFAQQKQNADISMKMADAMSKAMQSPMHMQMLHSQVNDQRRQVQLQTQANQLLRVAKYGDTVGGIANMFSGAASIAGGPIGIVIGAIVGAITLGFQMAKGAVGAASPDVMNTYNRSWELLSATVGQTLVNDFGRLSRVVQDSAGIFEELRRSNIGQGIGAVYERQQQNNMAIWGMVTDRIRGLISGRPWQLEQVERMQRGNNAPLLAMANFQSQQVAVEDLHDMLQTQSIRAPLDQAIFDIQRRSLEAFLESLGPNGNIPALLERARAEAAERGNRGMN